MTSRRALLQAMLPAIALGLAPACRAAAAARTNLPSPPARVGQLSKVPDSTRLRWAPGALWEPAALNMPFTAGCSLATDRPGMVELRIGSASLHLGPESQVHCTELSDSGLQFELVSGIASLRVRTLPAGTRVWLSAGGVRVQLLQPGLVRLRHVGAGLRLAVWVREGQARVGPALDAEAGGSGHSAGSHADLTLGADQHAVLERRTGAPLPGDAGRAVDEARTFDGLVDIRERRSETSFARLHTSAEMTGIDSLDGHGSWRQEPGVGNVWLPDRLPPDWAPYRAGRWRWLPPWGWTWLDDAPWGFAPFHYGRWLFVGGRWAWAPGLQQPDGGPRPVYAPALVGFYGKPPADAAQPAGTQPAGTQPTGTWQPTGSPVPLVGWYPLAPGELYWPAWPHQPADLRALNAGQVADLDGLLAQAAVQPAGPAHRHARTSFAATAMPLAAFRSEQPVAQHQVALSPAALAQAPLSGRRLPPPPPPPPPPPVR